MSCRFINISSDLKSIDLIELIGSSLNNILQDPENATIDTSIPPSLLLILEQVRSTLQEQQENIEKAVKANHSQDIEQGKQKRNQTKGEQSQSFFFPLSRRLKTSNNTIKYHH